MTILQDNGIVFRVYGQPAPQGSKRYIGQGRMVEMSKKVKPWRRDVVAAAQDALAHLPGFQPFTGPVALRITFFFARPKHHFRQGRFAGELKPAAPVYVITHPDLDKLVRSTCDGLTTAGVWKDDNLAAEIRAAKKYDTVPGASVHLVPLQVTP